MKAFVTAAGRRAAKTFAQTTVALLGVDAVGVHQVDWVTIGSVSATAAILSLLTSVANGLPETDTGRRHRRDDVEV